MNNKETKKINSTLEAIFEFSRQFKGVELKRLNPHLKNKYASWSDVWNASKELLDAIGIMTTFVITDNKLMLCAQYQDYQQLQSMQTIEVPENAKNKAQAFGSLLTYYKRYLFCAMFNICEIDDDDGQALEVKETEMITERQHSQILDLKDALEIENEKFYDRLEAIFETREIKSLTMSQASQLLKTLSARMERQNG